MDNSGASKSGKQSFLHGTVILAGATAIVKIIGAIYKIPIGNLLGGDGYAHFMVAYNVYSVLLVLSTAGLPVAVSKMVAEANARGKAREIRSIFKIAMAVFLVVGLLSALGIFISADFITADIMNSPDSVYAVRVIAPACLFVAIMSVFRGYYQGLSNMYPTAISQIIEAMSKLVIGYGLAWWLAKNGYDEMIVASGAIMGVMIGTLLGAVFLFFRKALDKNPPRGTDDSARSNRDITKSLLAIAIPITIGSGVLSLTNFIDTALVMRRLQGTAGFSYDQAKFLYGSYGLAQTLFNFPCSFIPPLTAAIVPALSAALARKNHTGASRTIESSMRITSLLAFPAAAGLSVLSGPILSLLYYNRPEEVAVATLPLSILSIAVIFNCIVMLTNAILQSLGKVRIPVYTMIVGAVVKIVANLNLVGIPEVNINGAPVGTCLCYGTIMVLNLIFISRNLEEKPKTLSMFVKPLIASALMGGAAWAANGLLCMVVSPRLAVLGAILIAVVIYFILVLVMRMVTREDLLMLPKGHKIATILKIK